MLQAPPSTRVMLLRYNGKTFLALMLCMFFALLGCKKSPSSCLRQQVPALLKKFNKHTEKNSIKLLTELEKRCAPPSPTIKFVLASRRYDLSPSSLITTKSKLVRLDRKDYEKQWLKACPELPIKKRNALVHMPYVKSSMYIYDHCKTSAPKVLSRTQALNLARSGYTTLYAPLITYGWLRQAGVPEKQVQTFVQETFLLKSHEQEIRLLPSFSPVAIQHKTSLVVSSQSMFVNRKKVCDIQGGKIAAALKKGQSDTSYLILPLYEALQEAAKKRKALSKFTKQPFKAEMNILLAPQLSYRLLSELLYTAGQAGFQHYNFVVGQEKIPFYGAARVLRTSAPELSQKLVTKQFDLSKMRFEPSLQHALSRGMAKGKGRGGYGSGFAKPKPHKSAHVILVKLASQGIQVRIRGRNLKKDCTAFHNSLQAITLPKEQGRYPTHRWASCFRAIQKKWSGKRKLVLTAPNATSYRVMLAMLNAMRYAPDGTMLLKNVEFMAAFD